MMSPLLGRFLVSFKLQSAICDLQSAVCSLQMSLTVINDVIMTTERDVIGEKKM